MFRSWPVSAGCVHLVIFLLICTTLICEAKGHHRRCDPSSCGNIPNISYPFRLKDDPKNCGEIKYELSCDKNQTVLELGSKRYHVKAINYYNFSIRIIDPGLDSRDDCSSFPIQSLYSEDIPRTFRTSFRRFSFAFKIEYLNHPVTYIRCADPANSSLYVDTSSCSENRTGSSISSFGNRSYLAFGDGISVSDVEDTCSIEALAWVSSNAPLSNYTSFQDIHSALAYGFELLWYQIYCGKLCTCSVSRQNTVICNTVWPIMLSISLLRVAFLAALYVAAKCVCCGPCCFAFLVYKLRRRHSSAYHTIEDFLQSNNNLIPVRYSYSQLRKMTWGFKDRLGEGGYGTVFKGKLRSGPLAAVKLMKKSKATSQEFLNEVATIGRIHHVNIVQLIGFCAQDSQRALVYDYMPNGSLDKYIFPREELLVSLSWEKIYEISLGVARGIEYLHRGCNMQILHFDIKPHNILLDENFIPKISDFGLAKLYSTDDSIVELTGIRGTMGYMAPEIFYKNLGGISYKADVYSFGMLLMEMAGRRKNLNAFADHSSQIYFPTWAYEQLNHGKEIEMGDRTSESERKIVKKMIMVVLWCIQMKPSNRPSMSKVIKMLEEDIDQLVEMPPKPFLVPEEVPTENTDGLT